ncbi:hypothetical protein DFJ74DRAFT_746014 [Hyaloraphidium curvatum]|nr:hypothetical protein DFJ74DRAFT_746014 [Hyaloraphidium curvatum]
MERMLSFPIRGSFDALLRLFSDARACLPLSPDQELDAQMYTAAIAEDIIRLFLQNEVALEDCRGISGWLRTFRRYRAWMAIVRRTEEDWLRSLPFLIRGRPTLRELRITQCPALLPADFIELLDSTDPADVGFQVHLLRRLARVTMGTYGRVPLVAGRLYGFLLRAVGILPPLPRPSNTTRQTLDANTFLPDPRRLYRRHSHVFLASQGRLGPNSRIMASTATLIVLGIAGQLGLGTYYPSIYFVRNTPNKLIAIVVRGSAGITDLLCDFAADSAPFRGGYAHGFFLAVAQLVTRPSSPFMIGLQALMDANPGFRIVLVGHSLGAAIATLVGALLAPEIDTDVRVVAFGPPAVVSLGVSGELRGTVTSFVTDHDLISRLSAATVMDAERLINAVHDLGCADEALARDDAMSVPGTGGSELDEHATWFCRTRSAVEEAAFGPERRPAPSRHRLYPAGRILWMRTAQHGTGQLFEAEDPEALFDLLVATPAAMLAHTPDSIECALDSLSTRAPYAGAGQYVCKVTYTPKPRKMLQHPTTNVSSVTAIVLAKP